MPAMGRNVGIRSLLVQNRLRTLQIVRLSGIKWLASLGAISLSLPRRMTERAKMSTDSAECKSEKTIH
jgi:hypothetical protein